MSVLETLSVTSKHTSVMSTKSFVSVSQSCVRQTVNTAPPSRFPRPSFLSQRSEPATNVLTAGDPLSPEPLVDTETDFPAIVRVALAVPVIVPAVFDVNVMVH